MDVSNNDTNIDIYKGDWMSINIFERMMLKKVIKDGKKGLRKFKMEKITDQKKIEELKKKLSTRIKDYREDFEIQNEKGEMLTDEEIEEMDLEELVEMLEDILDSLEELLIEKENKE